VDHIRNALLEVRRVPTVAQCKFHWLAYGKRFGFNKPRDYQKKDEFCQRPLLTDDSTRGTVELGTNR